MIEIKPVFEFLGILILEFLVVMTALVFTIKWVDFLAKKIL